MIISRNGLSSIASQHYGESETPGVSTKIGSYIGDFESGYPQSKFTEKVSDYGIKKGLDALGVPGRTAYGLLDDAEDARFDLGKTSLNVAKDVTDLGLGLGDTLAMPGLDVAYSGIMEGPEEGIKSAVKTGASILGGILGAPLGPIGAKLVSLGTRGLTNLAFESYDDGMVGDAFNARENETARDNLESSGYSYGESKDATRGSTNARGTGGTPSESASKEMGRASGLGRQSYGGYNDGGYGDSGGDSGAHDSMGGLGGSGDRDSSPGGMGGL